jgi:membrane protease YdiL (CAAX protease family)
MDVEREHPDSRHPRLPAREPAPVPVSIVRAAAQFYALLLAAAVVWTFWLGESLIFRSPADAARGIRVGADFGLGLAAAGVVIVFSDWLTRRTRLGRELAAALAGVLGRRSLVECVFLAVVSGVAEEAFFRAALQPQVGLTAASLIFGVVHFVPRREFLPWTVFAVAAGFLLGWLFETTGNLVAPVVAHATINAVNLWLLSSRDDDSVAWFSRRGR